MPRIQRPECRQQRRKIAQAVGLIFTAVGDDGAEAFERVCRDEGLLWRCPNCGWNVDMTADLCEECGDPAWV